MKGTHKSRKQTDMDHWTRKGRQAGTYKRKKTLTKLDTDISLHDCLSMSISSSSHHSVLVSS